MTSRFLIAVEVRQRRLHHFTTMETSQMCAVSQRRARLFKGVNGSGSIFFYFNRVTASSVFDTFMSENACGQVIMWYWKQRQQPLISEKCHGVLMDWV